MWASQSLIVLAAWTIPLADPPLVRFVEPPGISRVLDLSQQGLMLIEREVIESTSALSFAPFQRLPASIVGAVDIARLPVAVVLIKFLRFILVGFLLI